MNVQALMAAWSGSSPNKKQARALNPNPSFCLSSWSESVRCDGQSRVAQLGTGRTGLPCSGHTRHCLSSVRRGSSSPTFLTGHEVYKPFLGPPAPSGLPRPIWPGHCGSSNGLSSFQDLFQNPGSRPACYNQKKTASYTPYAKGHFLPNDLLRSPGSQLYVASYGQTIPRVERLKLAGGLSICCLPHPLSKR